MRRLTTLTLAATMCLALPAHAQSKEEACALQAEVVSAIQTARLDRVRQADVVPTLTAANPDWPEAMAQALPPLVDWIYSQKRRDLRDVDLGAQSKTQCEENWDQLQALQN